MIRLMVHTLAAIGFTAATASASIAQQPGVAPQPSANPASPAVEPVKKEKSMESAKRRVPKVAPVVVGAIRYEVLKGARSRGFSQNGGVIAALEASSGKELWTLQIYTTAYDAHEEADSQDRHITKMVASLDGKHLVIESENKKTYMVDLAARSVSIQP